MQAFNWTEVPGDWTRAPGDWPQLGPQIAAVLRTIATMPMHELRRRPEPLVQWPVLAPTLSVYSIQRAVCAEFCININHMLGAGKQREFALPRQIAIYLARELLPSKSVSVIAREFRRDHTTALYACKKMRKATGQTADTIARLKAQLMP